MTTFARARLSFDARRCGAVVVMAVLAACTTSATAHDDFDAAVASSPASSAAPPAGDGTVDYDSAIFASVDGAYGAYSSGSDGAVATCEQCACPSGTYCFGGATGHTVFSGTCDQTDAGGDGLEIGCEPLPPACANEPNCVCLLEALRPRIACEAICAEVSGFTVYCPVP